MIRIKDTEFEIRFTMRAMMLFEALTKKAFELSSLTDEYIFFYCIVMANNKDSSLTFDEFIDELDNRPEIVAEFKIAFADYIEKMAQAGENDEDGKKKPLTQK